jgi:hypothetical protein
MSLFDNPTVVDHIATSTSSEILSWTGGPSGFSSQQVYGYYLTDGDDNYAASERFDTPFTMTPGGVITVRLRFRHRTSAV